MSVRALFPPGRTLPANLPSLLYACGVCLWLSTFTFAQKQLPYLDGGQNSAFAQLDFAEMTLKQDLWRADTDASRLIKNQGLSDSGSVSALDLAAPQKAVQQFDRAASLLKAQRTQDAIKYLQKAIEIYPRFVSAHTALGLAYSDENDHAHAQEEFETASRLDDSFPSPFLNLGILALSSNDFGGAVSNLAKAASLSFKDPKVLTALAFAQNGDHKYAEALRTCQRVHNMNHRGLANVHYIAAAAAMSLDELGTARGELNTFLAEDPTNPLAPVAGEQLKALMGDAERETRRASANAPQPASSSMSSFQTFPNSEHLKTQLRTIADDTDTRGCDTCDSAEPPPHDPPSVQESNAPPTFVSWNRVFTIHQAVDETALFFSVSHHGRTINDLALSDIDIRDDNKPPAKILQFVPQSKLPLRLGLLIDSSDSVSHRFAFEKHAAEKFVAKVVKSDSDLAFVAGFKDSVSVTQDFTGDTASLTQGIEKISEGGETALFDAIYYASWKLAAHPEEGRVAKVLVVLTDGEDNSSHRSLQQTIEEAEAAGITIYTVSTSDMVIANTDANDILRAIADRSGGESIFPGSLQSLDKYLAKLPDEIRSRYLIAYRPADLSADGRYRRLQVRAAKAGTRLKVHVRKGYYTRLDTNRTEEARR